MVSVFLNLIEFTLFLSVYANTCNIFIFFFLNFLQIINRIKTSCQNLSDEELSKLSVNLLNCQSAVEGRPLYKCTDTMVRVLVTFSSRGFYF